MFNSINICLIFNEEPNWVHDIHQPLSHWIHKFGPNQENKWIPTEETKETHHLSKYSLLPRDCSQLGVQRH